MGVSLLAFFQWIFRTARSARDAYRRAGSRRCSRIAYVVIVVMARLRTFEPALEEAALDLGAPNGSIPARHTAAACTGIAAAALLAFTMSFDDYVITSMVAGVDSETLPMVIYAMARRGANPVVNAISTDRHGPRLLIVVSERLASHDAAHFIPDGPRGRRLRRDPRPRLNVFNWSGYVAPDTIPNFEREFDVRVRYAVYESNEEMLAA